MLGPELVDCNRELLAQRLVVNNAVQRLYQLARGPS